MKYINLMFAKKEKKTGRFHNHIYLYIVVKHLVIEKYIDNKLINSNAYVIIAVKTSLSSIFSEISWFYSCMSVPR